MKKPIIEIKGLSKVYNIGHEQAASVGSGTLRDVLSSLASKPLEFFTGHKLRKEKFWALNDININIEEGDVVGIIGRNGSGKSTILKILSRIVEPSDGEIIMRGRSASLLEVGTGFHPELTGRENIYFNGAILGMSQKEIRGKFDEIVAFSGVEKFLDTPVKFYSSGMYVRLAFAVAAHLEPDILIVDEVLAVGDAEFQKKSLGKMRDVTLNNDRTVLFVSHNMEAIQSICNKCIWLNGGKVVKFGPTKEVIEAYSHLNESSTQTPIKERKDRQGTGVARFNKIEVKNLIEKQRTVSIILSITNTSNISLEDLKLSVGLVDKNGSMIANLTNSIINRKINLGPGENELKLIIENISLVPGSYSYDVFLAADDYGTEIYDWVIEAGSIRVPEYDYYQVGGFPAIKGNSIYMDFRYETKI